MAQRNQQYEKEYAIIRFHGFFMDDSVGVAKNPNARFPISLASECEMSPSAEKYRVQEVTSHEAILY